MQKDHWQHHRMIFDFMPFFEGDREVLQFLETWYLFTALISLTEGGGFTRQRKDQAELVCKSLMAQYEVLVRKRKPSYLQKCCVSYMKMLLIPEGERYLP